MIFKSTTYTIIIMNSNLNLLMVTCRHMGFFLYPSFNKYSLRWLYHICQTFFNSNKDLCNLIEYKSWEFDLHVLSVLNSLEIFLYISLSSVLYKYVITTSIKHIWSLFYTAKLIRHLNVIAHIIKNMFSYNHCQVYEKSYATKHALYQTTLFFLFHFCIKSH